MMKTFIQVASSLFVSAIVSSGQLDRMIVGTALATATSTSAIIVTKEKKKIKTLIEGSLTNSQTMIKGIEKIEKEVKAVTHTTEKVAKEVRTLKTNSRLLVGATQKVQHQQKLTTATLNQQQQQLNQLTPQEKPTPGIETEKRVIPLPQKRQTVTHIYIDGNNFSKTTETLGLEIDWKALKIALVEPAKQTDTFTLKYYTGLHEHLSPNQKQWLHHLKQLNYEVITFPLSQRENGWKTLGDDLAMGLDLIEAVKPGDRVILVTGDGDFIPLIERLQARNVDVNVVGASVNTNSRLQALLKQDFIPLESISDQIVKLKRLTA
ncbi:NYN domain-containing protein [Microcystis aeruginosa]|nr:NYN domain-containing protein [Microcystis aeruginosa]